jgi:DNA repair protein RadC
MRIQDWPLDQRPRERLLKHGPLALTDAQLLAVLLGTGLKGQHVLDLSNATLLSCGGVTGLLRAIRDLRTPVRGVGPAKRAVLMAALELVHRGLQEQLSEQAVLDSPAMVMEYLQLKLAHKPHEVFAVLFLDTHNKLRGYEEMFRGTLNQTSVYPREVVQQALHHGASAVVLAHNHPSGCLEPSSADLHITANLRHALDLIDVRLLDHFIVTQGRCLSMHARGLI